MINLYNLLLKLVTNLIIKPERSKPSFKDIPLMKGCENILEIASYKEKQDSSMEHVQTPDKAKLSVLAAELLMAKLEVEQMNSTSAAIEQGQDATSHQNFTNETLSVTGTLKMSKYIIAIIYYPRSDGSTLQVHGGSSMKVNQSVEEVYYNPLLHVVACTLWFRQSLIFFFRATYHGAPNQRLSQDEHEHEVHKRYHRVGRLYK